MKQICIFAGLAFALVIGAIAYASNQEAENKTAPRSENIFAGKAIIITPTVDLPEALKKTSVLKSLLTVSISYTPSRMMMEHTKIGWRQIKCHALEPSQQ